MSGRLSQDYDGYFWLEFEGVTYRCVQAFQPTEKLTVTARVTRLKPKPVYHCTQCGKVCGTRANPKRAWWSREGFRYYCLRTCSPGQGREECSREPA